MDYAIIQTGEEALLEVVKLTDWQDYEWDQFATLKEKKTGQIAWFKTEEEAIEFLLAHFTRSTINPKYIRTTSSDGRYHI